MSPHNLSTLAWPGDLPTSDFKTTFILLAFELIIFQSLRRNRTSRGCSNNPEIMAGLKSVYKGPLFYLDIIKFKPNGPLHKTN